MPFRTLNLPDVAQLLHLTDADIDRLVRDRDIPFERRGGQIVFRLAEIEAWASQRILKFSGKRLAEFHQKSSRRTAKLLQREALLPELIRPDYIDPAMTAKTKASVVREMAALADRTGLVCDPAELIATLVAREKLCSTAMPGGVAFLHPRSPLPYLFEASCLVFGHTIQPIHFGALDGQPTDLFFLLCIQNDVLHLHTLARLCLMVQKTNLLGELRTGADAAALHERLLEAEQVVMASLGGTSGPPPIGRPEPRRAVAPTATNNSASGRRIAKS